jgi:two-component system catabolic regulation response regulator CreB
MPTVLIADDEQAIADAVSYALRADGYAAEHVLLGRAVLPRVQAGGVDLVVLDVGLPDMTGFDVCRALRQSSDVPVIFLTARVSELDRVLGLELGADDYVVKPFSPRELVARVRACLRRRAPPSPGPRQAVGRFEIDREGHRVRYRGQWLDLTRYEYGVLEALLARLTGQRRSRARARFMWVTWVPSRATSESPSPGCSWT